MYRNRHGHLFGRFGPGRELISLRESDQGATMPARSEFSSMNCCRRPGSLPKSWMPSLSARARLLYGAAYRRFVRQGTVLRVADPAGGDRFPGCLDRSCERGLRSGYSLGRSLGGGVPLPDGGRPPHGGLYPGIRCCGNSSFGRIRRGRYGGEFRGMARRRTSFRDFRKRCGQMCRIAARCDADPGGAFCPRACAAGTGGARCGPHGGYRVLRAFLPEGFRRHPVEKEVILNYRRECVPGCVE